MAMISGSTKGVIVRKGGKEITIKEVRTLKGGVLNTVWRAASGEEFYWIKDGVVQSGFPSAYNVKELTPSGALNTNTLTGFWLYGSANANTFFSGTTNEISTGGNRYMEITFGTVNVSGKLDKVTVGGQDITSQVAPNAVVVVDVGSLSSVSIGLDVTAWAGGNQANVHIKSIRFYS